MRISLFQSILTLTLIIEIWLVDCHFELKLPNAFSAFHPLTNTCQLKCLKRLLVAWQYGTQLVFGMIITDSEHWRLRLKCRDYHGIIAQRTPYKYHNAKRACFVLVFDVVMQWVYWFHNLTSIILIEINFLTKFYIKISLFTRPGTIYECISSIVMKLFVVLNFTISKNFKHLYWTNNGWVWSK